MLSTIKHERKFIMYVLPDKLLPITNNRYISYVTSRLNSFLKKTFNLYIYFLKLISDCLVKEWTTCMKDFVFNFHEYFIWYYTFCWNCFLNDVFSVNIEIIIFLLYLYNYYFPQNYEWNHIYFPGFHEMVTLTSSYEYRKHNNPKPWSILLLLCVPRNLVPIEKFIITLWKWSIISGSKYCFR